MKMKKKRKILICIAIACTVIIMFYKVGNRYWMNKKYEYIRYQECASRFLNAEMCLCRLVRDICFSVADAIDFNMDFLK